MSFELLIELAVEEELQLSTSLKLLWKSTRLKALERAKSHEVIKTINITSIDHKVRIKGTIN